MWARSQGATDAEIETARHCLKKSEAYADDSPPPEGLHPRPLFHAHARDPLTVQFFMTYVNPHDPDKQVTIRFFVTRETRVGQTP